MRGRCVQSAACGAMAGTVAAALTTPLDVAKTRIMLNERVYGTHRSALEPMTVRQVLADIWHVHGKPVSDNHYAHVQVCAASTLACYRAAYGWVLAALYSSARSSARALG